MKRSNVYILASVIIFIVFTTLNVLLYSEISKKEISDFTLISMSGLFVSGIFLFVLIIWILRLKKDITQTEHTEEGKKKEKPEESEDSKQEKDRIKSKIEKSILIILQNTDKQLDTEKYSETILRNLSIEFSIVQGLVFIKDFESKKFKVSATYAYYSNEAVREFEIGEGISGQVAKNQEMLNIDNIPDDYITVLSGLGSSSPNHLLIFPIVHNNETLAIVEAAAFSEFPEQIKEICAGISNPLGLNLRKVTAKYSD